MTNITIPTRFIPALKASTVVARTLITLGTVVALLIMLLKLMATRVLAFALPNGDSNHVPQRNAHGILMLKRMAGELEMTQPEIAAELYMLAASGN